MNLKTIKIEENTHALLKWVQSYDKLRKDPHTKTDDIIYKALCWYAAAWNYPLEEAKKLIEEINTKELLKIADVDGKHYEEK